MNKLHKTLPLSNQNTKSKHYIYVRNSVLYKTLRVNYHDRSVHVGAFIYLDGLTMK